MTKKNIKVAIVGGGWFGNFHLGHLLEMDGVEVTAFCSRSEKSVNEIGQRVPTAHTYTDYNKMLENEGLDAIVLCVPPHQHNNLEIEASQRGINLYIEKPLCVEKDEAENYASAIKESGIICSIGYQNLYNQHLQEVKNFLKDKIIGSVTARWIGTMPNPSWWRLQDESGGQIHEQATHLVNLMQYLFGNIITSHTQNRSDFIKDVKNCTVAHASSTIFTFENGLLATLSCGCFIDKVDGKDDIGIDIYTNKGNVRFYWADKFIIETAHETKELQFDSSYHKESLQAFIEAVQTNDKTKIHCDYDFALKTFKATYNSTH